MFNNHNQILAARTNSNGSGNPIGNALEKIGNITQIPGKALQVPGLFLDNVINSIENWVTVRIAPIDPFYIVTDIVWGIASIPHVFADIIQIPGKALQELGQIPNYIGNLLGGVGMDDSPLIKSTHIYDARNDGYYDGSTQLGSFYMTSDEFDQQASKGNLTLINPLDLSENQLPIVTNDGINYYAVTAPNGINDLTRRTTPLHESDLPVFDPVNPQPEQPNGARIVVMSLGFKINTKDKPLPPSYTDGGRIGASDGNRPTDLNIRLNNGWIIGGDAVNKVGPLVYNGEDDLQGHVTPIYDQINAGRDPENWANLARPLPTGTLYDDGNKLSTSQSNDSIVFYSIVTHGESGYLNHPSENVAKGLLPFASKQTSAYLVHANGSQEFIGNIPLSQASASYDASNHRIVFIGNTDNAEANTTRIVTSIPLGDNATITDIRGAIANYARHRRTIATLPDSGNREHQIYISNTDGTTVFLACGPNQNTATYTDKAEHLPGAPQQALFNDPSAGATYWGGGYGPLVKDPKFTTDENGTTTFTGTPLESYFRLQRDPENAYNAQVNSGTRPLTVIMYHAPQINTTPEKGKVTPPNGNGDDPIPLPPTEGKGDDPGKTGNPNPGGNNPTPTGGQPGGNSNPGKKPS